MIVLKRLKTVKATPLMTLRIELENRLKVEEHKIFDVTVGDRISVLYLDKLSEIGEDKEYVIHGEVKEIRVNNSMMCEICHKPCPHYFLLLDTSDIFGAGHKILNLHNILDINPYPHEYDLVENPEMRPKLTETWMVHELTHPQDIDMTRPNNPLVYEDNDKED